MGSRRREEENSSTSLADMNDHFQQSKAEQILKFLRDQEELNLRLKNNSISEQRECGTPELLRETTTASSSKDSRFDAVRPKTALPKDNLQVQRGSTAPTTCSRRPNRPKTSYGRKRVMTTPALGNRSKTTERQSRTETTVAVAQRNLPRPKTASGYYVLSEPPLTVSSGDTGSVSSILSVCDSDGSSSDDESDVVAAATSLRQTRRTAAERTLSSERGFVKRERQRNKPTMGGGDPIMATRSGTKTLISIDALPGTADGMDSAPLYANLPSTSANFATKIKCDASLYRKLRYKSAPSFRPLPIPGVANQKKISVYHLPPLGAAGKEDSGGSTKSNASPTLVAMQPQV